MNILVWNSFRENDLWVRIGRSATFEVGFAYGTRREVVGTYDGDLLAKVAVPYADDVPGGEAQRAFEALREMPTTETLFRQWVTGTVGADEFQRLPSLAQSFIRAAFSAGRALRG